MKNSGTRGAINTRFSALASSVIIAGMFGSLASPAHASDPPRDARSVHLWWHPSPEAQAFYNEVKVDQSTDGSYFCVCGFSHGYFGIQQSSTGSRHVIFSVWDPGNPMDFSAKPGDVPVDRNVKVLFCDSAVTTKRFGGEGTGQQSFYQLPWENGKTYKFLVTAKPDQNRTAYAAYIFDPRINRMKHLATFSTLANGDLIKGPYSFDEDFRRDGKSPLEVRSAYFANGWIQSASDGKWQPFNSATFTATNHPLTNIDAWSDSNGFGLATGGATQNLHAHVHDKVAATAAPGRPPRIDNLD
jgi:hypothetical protein